jgi:hypothetical protein
MRHNMDQKFLVIRYTYLYHEDVRGYDTAKAADSWLFYVS